MGVEEQRVNVLVDIVSPRTQWQTIGDAYRVDARIVIFSKADAVKVPASALFRDADNWMVFTVSDGVARKRAVQSVTGGGRVKPR